MLTSLLITNKIYSFAILEQDLLCVKSGFVMTFGWRGNFVRSGKDALWDRRTRRDTRKKMYLPSEGRGMQINFSARLDEAIEFEVKALLENAYRNAKQMLIDHRSQ